MVVVFHGQLYRQRMIRAFHKRFRARIFEIGQLVLKHIFPHQDEYKGKFAPNWQGPYMVHKVLSGGALVLSEMDGAVWPKPINSDAVKRYYAWSSSCIFHNLLVIFCLLVFVRIWILIPPVTNYVWPEFSRTRYVGGLCRLRSPHLPPFTISLYLNYVWPEFSRMRYVGGLCRPRSVSL